MWTKMHRPFPIQFLWPGVDLCLCKQLPVFARTPSSGCVHFLLGSSRWFNIFTVLGAWVPALWMFYRVMVELVLWGTQLNLLLTPGFGWFGIVRLGCQLLLSWKHFSAFSCLFISMSFPVPNVGFVASTVILYSTFAMPGLWPQVIMCRHHHESQASRIWMFEDLGPWEPEGIIVIVGGSNVKVQTALGFLHNLLHTQLFDLCTYICRLCRIFAFFTC